VTTIAEELAAWALEVDLEVIPPAVRHAATRHLLDGLGCALGAVRTGAAPAVVAWSSLATAPRQATILGLPSHLGGVDDISDANAAQTESAAHLGEVGDVSDANPTQIGSMRRPTHVAAGVNGYLVHALDFDDTHAGGLVHATAVVLPTVLAVGEEVGASGAEVLTAAVVGYEAICRLAAAAPHGFHKRGLHATSVCGVFAAALIAARLRGLDVATTVDALGVAGSLAGGSLEFLNTGSDTKSVHPGLAASNGVLGATLAAGGVGGPASILEGSNGFYRAYAAVEVDDGAVVDELGERWETERITIKPYPACQLVHAQLDAVRTLTAAIDPVDIDAVVVTIPPDSEPIVATPVDGKRRPRSDYEAKFSLPWSVATVLVDGDLTIDAFGLRDRAEVLALADRVTHTVADPGVPAADAPGRVRVTLRDGRHLDGHVASSRGGPTNPLDDTALVAKFHTTADLQSPIWVGLATDASQTPPGRAIDEVVFGLADLPDLRPLLDALPVVHAFPTLEA